MGGKNKVYELMIEIGQTSQPLKSKLPNGYTHRWTVFVRGTNDSRIEHCIQRVVFQLHESFDDPHRDIAEPPFQVRETGYAGFEIPIEIYFKNRDRPNHVVFIHDLCLLTSKPFDSTKTEKLKFINPARDFEKCLIKSGAQLLTVKKEKIERSFSPPAKKQKSTSSVIPSKDMCKPQSTTPTNNSSSTPSSSSGHATANTSNPSKQNPKSSSKDFIDVFGAPLVFNSNQKSTNNSAYNTNNITNNNHHNHSSSKDNHTRDLSDFKDIGISNAHTPTPPPSQKHTSHQQSHSHSKSKSHHHSQSQHHSNHHHHNHQNNTHHNQPNHSHKHKHQYQQETPSQPQVQKLPPQQAQQEPPPRLDPFQAIQAKISSLSDCDRLQKIVDIIEEAGEPFNITPKKFEFDLKRLDKKTISKIERCLQL